MIIRVKRGGEKSRSPETAPGAVTAVTAVTVGSQAGSGLEQMEVGQGPPHRTPSVLSSKALKTKGYKRVMFGTNGSKFDKLSDYGTINV